MIFGLAYWHVTLEIGTQVYLLTLAIAVDPYVPGIHCRLRSISTGLFFQQGVQWWRDIWEPEQFLSQHEHCGSLRVRPRRRFRLFVALLYHGPRLHETIHL